MPTCTPSSRRGRYKGLQYLRAQVAAVSAQLQTQVVERKTGFRGKIGNDVGEIRVRHLSGRDVDAHLKRGVGVREQLAVQHDAAENPVSQFAEAVFLFNVRKEADGRQLAVPFVFPAQQRLSGERLTCRMVSLPRP